VQFFLACLVSLFESFRSAKHVYFDSAVMLIFFLLIGRYLDFKARKKAFAIATEFSLLASNYARQILPNKEIKIISSKDIKEDMILLVVAGDKIPADSVIIEGKSEIDMSLINGETLPKLVKKGDEIFAGTINLDSPLKIKVIKTGENSLLAAIVKITEEVENQKNKYVRLADRLSRIYTPIVHILAFTTFCLWYFFFKSDAESALLNATAVLIITCPCALALAVPIVQTITISGLIKKGILTKSGEALEKINEIDVIIFDKTGTLTVGNPALVGIYSLNKNFSKEEEQFYLKLAASMAQMSKHPLSIALTNSYNQEKFLLLAQENQGLGLIANFEETQVKLGKKEFCQITSNLDNIDLAASQNNSTSLKCFLKHGKNEILFLFCDQLKEDAKDVVTRLKKMHKKIILLSGDNKEAVMQTANELGIKEFHHSQTPITKVDLLKSLKNKGLAIMMIGDGLNDAPSLAFCDVSISFAKAADITKSISDIIIQGNKLGPIITLESFANKSIKLIRQNLLLALGYNAIAVPFAIAGTVTPLVAAIAMSSSSILVLLNSLRMAK